MSLYELPFEPLKSYIKLKLIASLMSEMSSQLLQHMNFRVQNHTLVTFAKSSAQFCFHIFLYTSMQFLMGFLNIEWILWGYPILVYFDSKYLKKFTFMFGKFVYCKIFNGRWINDGIISYKWFCRELFSLSFEANRASNGCMAAEKTQKYENDEISAKNTNLMRDLVSISAVASHRFNRKLSYFYHKRFRLCSIKWQ
jgi:hypothetical protein